MDIFDAIRKNDIQFVETMIIQEPSVIHHINDDHKTSLHIACFYNHTEIAQFLINAGANVGAKDTYGWTPLHYACNRGHTDVIQLLIDTDADVDITDEDGWTPLHYACRYDHTDVVQLLIDAGANVSAQIIPGWTPLHVACSRGHTTVVQLLMRSGVDWLVADDDNKTPVAHVIAARSHDVLVFLESVIDQLPSPEKKKLHAWRFREELTKTS